MRKTVLITGASSGLGLGMAREFAARGCDLALCARRVERLDALKAELQAAHPGIRIETRPLDVLDHDRVFEVFGEFRDAFGDIDRIVVNAGLGKGQPLGTGHFEANRQTADTNFVAALAQMEAAMELFRAQEAGHLVVVSSMSAMRGMPRNLTTYAATKAGVAALAEGLRIELMRGPLRGRVKVTTLFPGYIRSEMNERVKHTPFMIDTETGCRLMADAIEREPATAILPRWPWVPLSWAMRFLPAALSARFV